VVLLPSDTELPFPPPSLILLILPRTSLDVYLVNNVKRVYLFLPQVIFPLIKIAKRDTFFQNPARRRFPT